MIFNAELTNDQKNLDLNYNVFRYLEGKQKWYFTASQKVGLIRTVPTKVQS